MLIFTPPCRLYRTMKIEQLLQFFVNSNSVQSTVTNNKSVQQTVIDLVPIIPNPRITLIPYSNIQENLTINCYGTNDKNWNSDWHWKVMFNSYDKCGELYCWLLHLFVLLLFWWIHINSSVMVKYVINKLSDDIFHINPGIIHRSI